MHQHVAVLVASDSGRLVQDPYDTPIGGEHAVLHLEGLARSDRALRFGDARLAVLGVDVGEPLGRVRHPFLGLEPEDLAQARAHPQGGVVDPAAHVPEVRGGRDLLHEGAVQGLRPQGSDGRVGLLFALVRRLAVLTVHAGHQHLLQPLVHVRGRRPSRSQSARSMDQRI